MNWYALFVENGQEEVVQEYLNLYFDKSFLYSIVPKRKICEKKRRVFKHVYKKIFPGYVLINTNMNEYTYNKIRELPKIYYLVNVGACYSSKNGFNFTKIEEKEIVFITKLINEEGLIEYSQVEIENSNVKVKSGPLYGMENKIKKIDKRKKRAKIFMEFLEKEITFDVGIEIYK